MIREKNISVALRKLGVPPSLRGFKLMFEAMKLIDNNNDFQRNTMALYRELGKLFKISNMACERAIRNAIEVSFKYAGYEVLEEMFGSAYDPEKGRPTSSEFLACLYEYLKYEEDGDD